MQYQNSSDSQLRIAYRKGKEVLVRGAMVHLEVNGSMWSSNFQKGPSIEAIIEKYLALDAKILTATQTRAASMA